MKVVFASVSSVTNIPVVRFLINRFKRDSSVIVLESWIMDANAYFRNDPQVSFYYLSKHKSTEEYLRELGKKTITRYLNLIMRLFLFFFSKEKTLFYALDHQVLAVVLFLKKFLGIKQTGIIYHQFELVEKDKLGKFSRYMFQFVCKEIKNIDLLIFPEWNRKEYFLSLLSSGHDNTFIMPNSCNSKDVSQPDFSFRNELNITDDKIVCLHVGSIGGKNHYFDHFINVIKQINKVRNDIDFVFVGRLSEELKQGIEDINIKNIHLIPFVPHEQLDKVYKSADLGLILYRGSGLNYEFCAPNKLYEFWSYGIPVIGHKLKGLESVFKSKLQGELLNFDIELFDYLVDFKKTNYNRTDLIQLFERDFEIVKYITETEELIAEKDIYEK